MTLSLNTVHHGDALEILKTLPDASVDSVCTDPPYGLGNEEPSPEEILAYLMGADLVTGDFMGKDWNIPPVAVWKECFRVLKPGGHLLSFAGTRTFDLISMGIRMAGFENRDTIAAEFGPSVMQWVQSQGFPKSHSVDKAIDKKKGATRKVVGKKRGVGGENLNDIVNGREVRQTTDEGGKGVGAYGVGAKQVGVDLPVTAPESEEAKQWEGWGTALKPSWEPILMFRKPIAEKSVVAQVLATGTGALNIDGCRIGTNDSYNRAPACSGFSGIDGYEAGQGRQSDSSNQGRWPANFILVHSDGCKVVGSKKVKAPIINRFDDGMKPFGHGAGHEYKSTQTGDEDGMEEISIYECADGCPVKKLDQQSGVTVSRPDLRDSGSMDTRNGTASWRFKRQPSKVSDSGGASRFFAQFEPDAPFTYVAKASPAEKNVGGGVEEHPTVKPLKLMRYLVRLVTPPGGVVLDPYVGSGTTAVAALLEGVNFVAIEKHGPYLERIHLRILQATNGQVEPSKKREIQPQVEAEGDYLFNLALSDE